MSLTTGTRIGAYEIVSPLGAGGMGEVYRARDTRLDRDVALKFLPESFAADPDRRMRFEREAKTLAALNHPNIAAIYGIEDRCLVMELVEGEDLSNRIARGAMPVSEAVPMARQIAEALEAAHEAGVIHRDLKPANIKVRPDGTVKILDFGLAKAITPGADSGAGPAAAAVNSPTMTSPALTAMGLILGTAAYMSPEQAKGRPVDRRADIWAFGVVLCECGHRPTVVRGRRCQRNTGRSAHARRERHGTSGRRARWDFARSSAIAWCATPEDGCATSATRGCASKRSSPASRTRRRRRRRPHRVVRIDGSGPASLPRPSPSRC